MEIKMKITLILGILAAILVLGAYMCNADAEPLHHEVQVVTPGRLVAATYARCVRDDLAQILPQFDLFVDVVPHSGATTVKVTVISRQLSSRNLARIREILETAVRKPFVIVNGYFAIRQRPSFAYAIRR